MSAYGDSKFDSVTDKPEALNSGSPDWAFGLVLGEEYVAYVPKDMADLSEFQDSPA